MPKSTKENQHPIDIKIDFFTGIDIEIEELNPTGSHKAQVEKKILRIAGLSVPDPNVRDFEEWKKQKKEFIDTVIGKFNSLQNETPDINQIISEVLRKELDDAYIKYRDKRFKRISAPDIHHRNQLMKSLNASEKEALIGIIKKVLVENINTNEQYFKNLIAQIGINRLKTFVPLCAYHATMMFYRKTKEKRMFRPLDSEMAAEMKKIKPEIIKSMYKTLKNLNPQENIDDLEHVSNKILDALLSNPPQDTPRVHFDKDILKNSTADSRLSKVNSISSQSSDSSPRSSSSSSQTSGSPSRSSASSSLARDISESSSLDFDDSMLSSSEKSEKSEKSDLVSDVIITRMHLNQDFKLKELNKANLDFQAHNGDTILIAAINFDYGTDVTEAILEHKPNVNIGNKYTGMTPLMLAVKSNKPALVKALLEQGADVNLKNKNGDTALMFALKDRNHQLFYKLIQKGANPAITNQKGESVIHLAAKIQSDAPYFSEVLNAKSWDTPIPIYGEKQKTSKNKKSEYIIQTPGYKGGNTILTAAIVGGLSFDEINKYLSEHKSEVNIANKKSGMTPLMCAVQKNRPDIFELLLRKGADINLRNRTGDTALMIALKTKNHKLFKQLVKNGAEIDISNVAGVSVSDLAIQMRKTDPYFSDVLEAKLKRKHLPSYAAQQVKAKDHQNDRKRTESHALKLHSKRASSEVSLAADSKKPSNHVHRVESHKSSHHVSSTNIIPKKRG